MSRPYVSKGTNWIDNLLKEAINDKNAKLIINIPQPVVGVKIELTGRLKLSNGGEIPLNYLTMKYNWMRCTRTLNCSLPRCIKATINEPLRVAKYRCLLCSNQPGAGRMIFCSRECLRCHLKNIPHNNVKPITGNLRDWCDDIINSQIPESLLTLKYLPIGGIEYLLLLLLVFIHLLMMMQVVQLKLKLLQLLMIKLLLLLQLIP